MKTDRNYRMSKPTKCWLDQIVDTHERGMFKALFTEAENHSVLSRKKMQVKIVETEGED